MRIAFLTAAVTAMSALSCVADDSSIAGHSTAAWRQHIQPSADELAWMKINWLPDLRSGIEAGAKSGKPILLWTMNGHPFGCT
jgi:hypothetical protein